MSKREQYMRVWNRFRREYKTIWEWNKRHPQDQRPMPVMKKPIIELEEDKGVGNELWKQLTKEDEEWQKTRPSRKCPYCEKPILPSWTYCDSTTCRKKNQQGKDKKKQLKRLSTDRLLTQDNIRL